MLQMHGKCGKAKANFMENKSALTGAFEFMF